MSGIAYFIVSRKDKHRITFKVADGAVKMKSANSKKEYIQSFIGLPVADAGENRYRLHVREKNSEGQDLPATKFLDFNPYDSKATLFGSESSSGPSQVWYLEEHEEDVWLIQSSNGNYLKNNGSGKPILVSTLSDRDRNDKKFHWMLIPVY